MRTLEIFRGICPSTTTNEFWNDFQAQECMDAPDLLHAPTGGMRKHILASGEVVKIGWGYSGDHDVSEVQKPKGGKRVGSGRKALDDAGTVVATIRLTVNQKWKLERLGGAKWIRAQLDLFDES